MLPEIRKELLRFAKCTTVKGIGRTVRANNVVARTCWIVFLIVCFALLMFQVVTVLMNYYNYVVIQNMAVVQTSPSFPDVTICNLFPISDRKNFDERYQAYLKRLDYLRSHQRLPEELRTDEAFWHYLRSLVIFNVNILDPRIGDEEDPNVDGFVMESYEYWWDIFNGQETPLVLQNDRTLQRCVKIEASRNNTALVETMLFIDDFWSDVIDSFFSWTRMPMSTGVRVMVHPRGTKPDAKTSVFVAPGSDLTINVKQVNITRLPNPRSNCTDRRFAGADCFESIPYNQATCISLCRQRQVIEACKCIDAFEIFTEADLQSVSETFCINVTRFLNNVPPRNDTAIDDLWRMIKCVWYFIPVEDTCDCPAPCSEISYELTVSEARWPSPIYQLAFYDRYLRNNPHYDAQFSAYKTLRTERNRQNGSNTLQRVRDLKLINDNLLRVTVKMNERTVTTVTDILAMSWDTMASNLGGSLNLWLGISVLTAAEIIELLYSLMQIQWNRKRTDVEVP